MGVPAFFRWLSLKYPSIVKHCHEEKPKVIDENTTIPVDTTKPNTNDMEFDNLYLDMNGIIHPCTHPENKPAPRNEEEMFNEIFIYIDRLFSIIRPRKLIYLAVDGVAPRAKMNQQRSRRFRAAKETREKYITIEKIKQEIKLRGGKVPDAKDKSEHFDSNCITPGTPFMSRLSIALQYYIYKKLNDDAGWKNIQVILSDASAPGEGEHKIMDFIRRQRASPSHDPNTRHCLCGADADLIMLGLATHEPHFTIIREEFKPNQPKPCDICGQFEHEAKECTGLSDEFNVGVAPKSGADTEFIFILLNVLREYLQQELVMTGLPFPYDFERAVDDWVFMCFFVGNDFLPHLPSLDIREKAIDRLVVLYKSAVYKTRGWLTDSGKVNLERVQMIMKDLALVEDEIFQNRRETEVYFRAKNSERRKKDRHFKRQRMDETGEFNNLNLEMVKPGEKFFKKEAIKESVTNVDASKNASQTNTYNVGQKRKLEDDDYDEEDAKLKDLDKKDEVKLWEAGYRKRYYTSKFGVSIDDSSGVDFCETVAKEYVRGLCWVLAYYYQGCPSWTWYYPYHYAPFAVDFNDIINADVEFSVDTKPFNPLEQLMGVFPADSSAHVPPVWADLMSDPESPVIDFYPTDFQVDLNGKRYEWQGVALLPFVDEERLLKALSDREHLLTPEERIRNVRTADRYFVRFDHNAGGWISNIADEHDRIDKSTILNPELTGGISGRIWICSTAYKLNDTIPSPIGKALAPDIVDQKAVVCWYSDPIFEGDGVDSRKVFMAKLLPGLKMPDPSIGPNAIVRDRPRRRYNVGAARRMVQHSIGHGNYSNNYDGNDRQLSWGMRQEQRFPPPYSNYAPPQQQQQYYNRGQFQQYGRDNYNRSGNNSNEQPYNRNGNNRNEQSYNNRYSNSRNEQSYNNRNSNNRNEQFYNNKRW